MIEAIKEELFSKIGFKQSYWNVLKKHLEIVKYKKNSIVTRFGSVENYVYFIVEGGVRIFYPTKEKDVCVGFYFEKEFISSYSSFLTRISSNRVIETLEDTVMIRINYNSFKEINRYREGNRITRYYAEKLYIFKERREASLLMETPDQRYLNLIKHNPSWFQRVPQLYIASYLGLSPETLSRVKRRNVI